MTEILIDYLDIYAKYPADKFLTKVQKKERHNALIDWTKRVYETMPTFEEVVAFMSQNETLQFEKPFLMKVLIPRVKEDVEQENIEALKFLFECNDEERKRIDNITVAIGSQSKNYIQMFQEGTNWEYSDWELADMILTREPDNKIVIYEKYIGLSDFLWYTIHEVPSGVLVGLSGAEKEAMPHMFKHLREFARLSKKLGKKNDEFIDKCHTFYQAWEQYLNYTSDYNGFEDYLQKQKIAY